MLKEAFKVTYLFILLCIIPDTFQLLCSDSRSCFFSCTLVSVAAVFQREGRKTTRRLEVRGEMLAF